MASEYSISKFLLIGLALVVLIILVIQYRSVVPSSYPVFSEKVKYETFVSPAYVDGSSAPTEEETHGEVMPSESVNGQYKSVNFPTSSQDSNSNAYCAPKDKLTSEDLLPKDAANSKWAQVVPAGQGNIEGQNYLTAGYLSGVNTINQSKKNSNLQIRSDPPIEKLAIGPWNMSTIESNSPNHRPFEIGQC